jgi:hypothetical protein
MVTLQLPNGQTRNVTSGQVLLPRTGCWIADLRIDEREDLPDLVVLDLGAVEMPAAVTQAELIGGMTEVRLVGGTGGMGEISRPKHYHRPLARHVLGDLLRDAGERLAASSTPGVLSTEFEAWTTLALPTGALLASLCALAGGDVNWRVLADGTIWIGRETWPDSGVVSRSIDSDGANAASIVGTDIPGLWPGTLLNGRRVDHVRHDLDADRTTVLFAEAAT